MAPPNRALAYGVPLIALTVCGTVGLAQFVQGTKDVIDQQSGKGDLRAPVQTIRARKFNMEDELAMLKGRVDINEYENKPVPKTSTDQN
ncbi:hypothetical protein CYMTET_12625 [Cymbomonas tetramitiformis]|uniref:Uncharacterized protein n=1 Tax=Cymbomonas tetramitiformis TaxID=36881 RepID=A0AAE0LBN5_9CHLO|nr:hypothetical protein CYMTET_12625 [Cymbomonas tetramitiformis]